MELCERALAAELMRSIRDIRDRFYDTERGLVDYEALGSSTVFRHYRMLTNALRQFDLSTLVGRHEKLAFWINLYNTIVVDSILTLGVRSSVKEVPEFFRNTAYRIGEDTFSPDDIEHGILRANARPRFRLTRQFGPSDKRRRWVVSPVDPCIHFALVCGSRSCAPIDYYDAGKIGAQLAAAAKSFVNSSEVLAVPETNKLMISEIFLWYEDDFGGKAGVLDFIYDYLVDEAARELIRTRGTKLNFEYIYYDWNLNR